MKRSIDTKNTIITNEHKTLQLVNGFNSVQLDTKFNLLCRGCTIQPQRNDIKANDRLTLFNHTLRAVDVTFALEMILLQHKYSIYQ